MSFLMPITGNTHCILSFLNPLNTDGRHDYFHTGSAIPEPPSGTASITSLKAVRCLYADDTKSQRLLVAYFSAIHRQKALGERNTGIVRYEIEICIFEKPTD